MDDVLFTRAERARVRPLRAASVVLVSAGSMAVPLAHVGGWVIAGITVGSFVLLVIAARAAFRRAWLRVGSEEVSYSFGLGRRRLIEWRDIQQIEVAERGTRVGPVRTVRVVCREGKPRILPVLADTYAAPDPDFDSKVAKIRALADGHRAKV